MYVCVCVRSCSHSEPTYVGSDQRHRVEVGELHVPGQILGVLLQQVCQLARTTTGDVVLTLSEGPPKPCHSRTRQHATAPQNVLLVKIAKGRKRLK